MENIQFKYVLKDGTEQEINIAGVRNIFEAADELRASITNGDTDFGLEDVVKIVDIPG